jgi:hypothetical protein
VGLGGDNAVLQAIVEFGAAVNRKVRAGGSVDGCDEVNCRMFHQFGF